MLTAISPANDHNDGDLAYIPDAAKRLPLPHMVLLTLILGTDCKFSYRPVEKTAWAMRLKFKETPIRLEHGKFGMRIATVKPPDERLLNEFVKLLEKAFPLTDEILQPHVEQQIRAGNVTVRNRHHLFRHRYEFLREEAKRAFAQPSPDLGDLIRGALSERKAVRSADPFKPEREGFFLGGAAIDAYFSWLEHILLLILPFAKSDLADLDMVEFMRANWREKLKAVWNVSTSRERKNLYDGLLEIKERFRNPITHGGFDASQSSLGIHMPYVGAIPANLSRFTESIHFGIFPLQEASFADACQLFDAVDKELWEGDTSYGMTFADSGLDVSFDAEMRKKYEAAMTSHEDFCDWLEGLGRYLDDLVNMDW
ncbi:MAG: hypothetical protein Q7R32_13045 [Dehalococcoidia bacterium]|nr:hypothetical protein [Dehalococcoidia bacterium]